MSPVPKVKSRALALDPPLIRTLDQSETPHSSSLRMTSRMANFLTLPEFDFGHLGLHHAAWQRAYAMPWRRRLGNFRLFDLVRDMEKP
jgi:hypothetical protein